MAARGPLRRGNPRRASLPASSAPQPLLSATPPGRALALCGTG
jgi:hypothetical protein